MTCCYQWGNWFSGFVLKRSGHFIIFRNLGYWKKVIWIFHMFHMFPDFFEQFSENLLTEISSFPGSDFSWSEYWINYGFLPKWLVLKRSYTVGLKSRQHPARTWSESRTWDLCRLWRALLSKKCKSQIILLLSNLSNQLVVINVVSYFFEGLVSLTKLTCST